MEEKQRSIWQIVLRSGLLGGVIATYLCIIGIVTAFSERYLVGTYITTGTVLLVFGMVVAGVLAARELRDKRTVVSFGGSLLSGVITSLPLILLIVITILFVLRPAAQGADFTLRDMFINLNPELISILTFGLGVFPGIPLLILVSALMAALGAGFILLPRRWSQGLISGITWVLLIGVFSDNVSLIVQQVAGRGLVVFMFQNQALRSIDIAPDRIWLPYGAPMGCRPILEPCSFHGWSVHNDVPGS